MSSVAIKCSVWLGKFLRRRSLTVPDQRSLYAYHCSYDEYVDLMHALRDSPDLSAEIKDQSVCASLVMFGSEWYRREYKSEHGWSWEPVWSVLGASLSHLEISRIVTKGLEGYWKRPLHLYEAGHRDFIGSLFCEGGLPFQVLREDGNRFQLLFNRLLAQHDDLALMGVNTLKQVQQSLSKTNLPQVFSSSAAVVLIAGMVDRFIALVRDFNLVSESEPVAKLDSVNPKWRELFPLPLDNDTGSDLLNGMLRTATREGKKRRTDISGWSCTHFWSESNSEILKTQISLPEELDFKLLAKHSTTRFELTIVEDGKVALNLGAGYATVEGENAKIRVRSRQVVVTRNNCASALSLVASEGGASVGSIPISGSAVALGDVPLGFINENNRWVLCGEGTFSTAATEIYIVTPPDASLTVSEQDENAELTADLSVLKSPAVLVRGKASLQSQGDELFKIKTGHVSASLGLELFGEQLPWSSKPVQCFIGLPKVMWPVGLGEVQQQGSEIFISGKRPFDGSIQEMLGVQWVSVRNRNSETLIRRKVGILPSDFRLELSASNQPGQGSIFMYTRQPCLLQVNNEGVEQKKVKHEGFTEYRLTATGIPPEKLSIRIKPNLLAESIDIEVPFPSFGCIGFDSKGNQLKREISVDNLLGSKLSLFSPPGVSTRYTLELVLLGKAARNASYQWCYTVAEKPVEIRLFNISEQIFDLLSLESGIDQVVELRVSGNGVRANYRIRRYATELSLDYGKSTISLSNSYKFTDDLPEPMLMLLHDPMRELIPLNSKLTEGVETGVYELPGAVEKDGPWLVVSNEGSAISFRPRFIAGKNAEFSSDAVQTLQKAVISFDPSSPVSAFTPVFDSMAVSPMHSGWQYLQSLYSNYSYLPMATFEVWKALVNHSRALSMALFKFEMDSKFLERLESEFPIFWETFPIKEVHLAARRFSAFLKVKGVAQPAIDALIERMYKRLGEVFPSYGKSVQNFLSSKPVGPEVNIPLNMFKVIIQDWHQELIRNRSDAQWPEFGGRRLKRWYENFDDSILSFDSGADHRSATLYLPIFAAAVASGDANFSDVFSDTPEATFFLRQVRDFDSVWFNAVYQYCLLNRVANLHKEELIND